MLAFPHDALQQQLLFYFVNSDFSLTKLNNTQTNSIWEHFGDAELKMNWGEICLTTSNLTRHLLPPYDILSILRSEVKSWEHPTAGPT